MGWLLPQQTYIYTLTTGIALTKKIGMYLELYGDFQQKDVQGNYHADGGFTYLINNNSMFDISSGFKYLGVNKDYFYRVDIHSDLILKENRTMQTVKLIECPRDAMQGWKTFIPTETKIEYINKLLEVGFDTLDFGSFVSAKAIPQLADTKEVLKHIKMTATKLLAIIANTRGAEDAVQYDEISYVGFPFSISETFQN